MSDVEAIRQRVSEVSDRPINSLLVNALAVSRDPQSKADARFLAHAREDMRALLAEVDRLTAEADEVYRSGYRTGRMHAGAGS